MTVSITTTKKQYAGTGSQTVFAYPFKIWVSTDLVVIVTDANGVETVKTLNVDYTVSGVGNDEGGNVTFGTAPLATEIVTILRVQLQKQEIDYVAHDPFPAEAHENGLDKLTMMVQELQERADRSPFMPRSFDGSADLKMPLPASAKLLGWDISGTALANYSATVVTVNVPQIDHLGNHSNSLAQAVADIGATKTLLWIHIANTVTANLTVPDNITLRGTVSGPITVNNGVTLTLNGALEAGPYQIFNCIGTGKVVFGNSSVAEVLPEWWGAKADDTTDCTTALQAAIDAMVNNKVKLQKGIYCITAPLVQKASLIGSGYHYGTEIKAKTGWSGSYMMDLYYGSATYKYGLRTKNIRWNANSLVSSVFGSSNDGIGNSHGFFENCWLRGATGWAVNVVTSAASLPGALTGSTWINVLFTDNAGGDWYSGNNQDDIQWIGVRLNTASGAQPLRLAGTNFTWNGGFCLFSNLPSVDGIKSVFRIEELHTGAFRNIFLETNSSDITHIVNMRAPQCNYTFENIHCRVDDSGQSTGLIAFLRGIVESWAGARYPQVHLKNIYADYDNPDWKLLDLFVGAVSGSNDFFHLDIHGCGGFDWPLFQWGSGSGTVARDTVYLTGFQRGNKWSHAFRQVLGTTNARAQTSFQAQVGIVTYNNAVDSASGLSPRTATVTLPSEGQWLVSVAALNVAADKNHMATGLWLVNFNDEATNDLLDSEQLGTTQICGFATTLTLGDPTTAGVCTATAEWSGGGSYMTRFVFRCRKLSNYTMDYDY